MRRWIGPAFFRGGQKVSLLTFLTNIKGGKFITIVNCHFLADLKRPHIENILFLCHKLFLKSIFRGNCDNIEKVEKVIICVQIIAAFTFCAKGGRIGFTIINNLHLYTFSIIVIDYVAGGT